MNPHPRDPHDTGYRVERLRGSIRRHLIDMAVLGVPFIGVLIWAIVGSGGPVAVAAAIVFALLLWLIGFRRERNRSTRLRCPRCDARLTRSDDEPAETPVVFVCRTCEVVWDTGFTVSDEL